MEEKSFINNQLGIKLNSYIDNSVKFGLKQNKFTDTWIQTCR